MMRRSRTIAWTFLVWVANVTFSMWLQDLQTPSVICWASRAKTSCTLETTSSATSSNRRNVRAGRRFWSCRNSPWSCKCGRSRSVRGRGQVFVASSRSICWRLLFIFTDVFEELKHLDIFLAEQHKWVYVQPVITYIWLLIENSMINNWVTFMKRQRFVLLLDLKYLLIVFCHVKEPGQQRFRVSIHPICSAENGGEIHTQKTVTHREVQKMDATRWSSGNQYNAQVLLTSGRLLSDQGPLRADT